YYASSPSQNPIGPSTGSYRVNRGGSWNRYPQRCRVAYRFSDSPYSRYYFIGFRLARAVSF
ncbi:MAG: SUMF1/EgtB/PvdO family nonheme iron enzyme, partial [Saprospiraceae bacterium]|nr:SUMF1/EgtB/PvdO family nonheme iron enzyme [Saprospiraceae bacterium]